MRTYDEYTQPEFRLTIRKLVKKFPYLDKYFQALMKDFLNPIQKHGELHPLFWTLANPAFNYTFAEGIKMLVDNGYPGVVREVISNRDRQNFYSLESEIRLFRHLKLRNLEVEWGPKIKQNNGIKNPDFCINKKYYLEVLNINDRQKEMDESEAMLALRIGYNNLVKGHGYPFAVSATIHEFFDKEYLPLCLDFIQEVVPTLQRSDNWQSATLEHRGGRLMTFRFYYTKDRKGYWAAHGTGVRSLKNSARAKNKVLDKLDKWQFPDNVITGYFIFIDSFFCDHQDVASALMGQETITFNINDLDAPVSPTRSLDGVIHDPERGKLLLDKLDFVISSKLDNGLISGSNKRIFINEDRKKVTEEEINQIFF